MSRISVFAIVVALLSGCGRAASRSGPPVQAPPPEAAAAWRDSPPEAPGRGGPEGSSERGYSSPSARAEPARETEAADDLGGARPAPSSPADKSRGMAERREERPGLGTEWGDSRTSHVTDAPFARRSFDTPWASSMLYYNDADGIRAMTRGAALSSYAVSSVAIGGGALSVRLVDAWGSPLPTYDLGSRKYVSGRDGDRYVIRIQNHTGQRFEAVASVDGLDVIDGRAGSLAKRGYLIAPFSSLEIEGFRKSMHEVAEFQFGSVSNSYAARTGSDRNVGVIGVAFFDERGAGYPWFEREAERRHDAQPFPGRFAPAPR